MRKKIVALIMAVVMIFGFAGALLAEDNTTPTNPTPAISAELTAEGKTISSEAKISGKFSIKALPGYQELLRLRSEGLATKNQIAHNQVQTVQAVVYAKQANKDIAPIVKVYRENHKNLSNDLKKLWAAQRSYWKVLKAARHAKDKAKMEAAMNQILTGRKAINNKLLQIKALQEKLLVDLQNAPLKAATVQQQVYGKVETQSQVQNQIQSKTTVKGNGLALGKVLREKMGKGKK